MKPIGFPEKQRANYQYMLGSISEGRRCRYELPRLGHFRFVRVISHSSVTLSFDSHAMSDNLMSSFNNPQRILHRVSRFETQGIKLGYISKQSHEKIFAVCRALNFLLFTAGQTDSTPRPTHVWLLASLGRFFPRVFGLLLSVPLNYR
jgi:hypothetical protein